MPRPTLKSLEARIDELTRMIIELQLQVQTLTRNQVRRID